MKLILVDSDIQQQCMDMVEDTAMRHLAHHDRVPGWICVSPAFCAAMRANEELPSVLLIHGIVCIRNPKLHGLACYSVESREAEQQTL